VNGKPVEDIVDILVKDRIILEKTKPLELKLKYQIDQLVKGKVELKPQPEQLVSVEQPTDTTSSAIYKPPRIQPLLPTIKEKKEAKLRKPSKILKELQDQYDDKPEMIAEELPDHIAERKQFEEENFVRLTLSKKERKQRDRFQTDLTNEFQELNEDFKSIKDFIGNEEFKGVVDRKRPMAARKDEFKSQKRVMKRFKR
jgi:U3 small nucleolar ribonucleoprotein protein LCP5